MSAWLVSRSVDAFLHRLHDFFMRVRLCVGTVSFPKRFLDLAGYALEVFRPQRLLHAQRCLAKQMQQAKESQSLVATMWSRIHA